MLAVEGRTTRPISADELRADARAYGTTLLDIGTGDGKFPLAVARARPDAFVLGVDANAAGMAESSRRASRGATRLENVRFVAAPAETLAETLAGFADDVRVHFPWGSLLRGIATADPATASMLRTVARPGASITVLLSIAEADHSVGLEPLEERAVERLAAAYGRLGLERREVRRVTRDDIAAAHSSWGKRLDAAARRAAWRLTFHRS